MAGGSKALRWIVLAVGLALLLVGSLRFEPLDQRRARLRAQQFDAKAYARDFWDHQLPQVLDQAVDAGQLIRWFNTDMPTAIAHGRTLGDSRVHAYLVRGTGTVVAEDSKGLLLSLASGSDRPSVRLLTGRFIAGNAVRDASGRVDVSDFSDTMKFNRIGSEINRIVVQEVILPFLKSPARAGQSIRFIGAAEVAEDATEAAPFGSVDAQGRPHVLSIVPIRLAVPEEQP